jgi:hypothetical protein
VLDYPKGFDLITFSERDLDVHIDSLRHRWILGSQCTHERCLLFHLKRKSESEVGTSENDLGCSLVGVERAQIISIPGLHPID